MGEAEEISLFGELMGSVGIYVAYVLIGIAVLGALFSAVLGAVKNSGNIKQAAIGFGALLVVLVISYVLADDVMPKTSLSAEELAKITTTDVKLSSTGIVAFYILLLAAIAATVYSEVSRFFK